MDYVEGKILEQLAFPHARLWACSTLARSEALTRVHEQLADVYIQLRQLEFPTIGALGLPPERSSGEDAEQTEPPIDAPDAHPYQTCRRVSESPPDVSGITVRNRPIFIELLMQEVEGLDPTPAFPPGRIFNKSTEYARALAWLADNGLDKARENFLSTRECGKMLYGYHDFKRYVMQEWLEKDLDDGPFVLMHGDLSFHASNILWDENFKIVAILDWEWSYVVPAQFFVPPLWLTGFFGVEGLSEKVDIWAVQARHLYISVPKREKALGFTRCLSLEWRKMKDWPHTLIALALLQPDTIYNAYWTFLAYNLAEGEAQKKNVELQDAMAARVAEFLRKTPSARFLLEQKVKEQK